MDFNPVDFFKRPTVILKVICLVWATIVFGCISHGGYEYEHCLYGDDVNACNYGVWIGVIAFLASVGGLILELFQNRLPTTRDKRLVIICELAFSALWAFLWFVGFCYLCNKWANADAVLALTQPPSWKYHNVRAGIAFSFFSILTWSALTFFTFLRYKEQKDEMLFASADDVIGRQVPPQSLDTPYNPYQEGGDLSAGGASAGGYQQFQDQDAYKKTAY